MSATFFVVLGVTLAVAIVILTLWNTVQAGQSVAQILAELEARPPK